MTTLIARITNPALEQKVQELMDDGFTQCEIVRHGVIALYEKQRNSKSQSPVTV